MKGERSPWEGENEEKGQHMQEKENAGWNTSEEDALGLWLRKAVREGAYTEEYCTKLEAYEKVTKNEAAVLYFAARLAFALGEMEEAHRLAHEAYARRKLSHKVWQLLFEIGDALGLDERFYLISAGCGATGAIKKFEEIMGLYLPPMSANRLGEERLKGANLPLVIISPYEHHSNEISLREGLCEVVRIPLSKSGEINFGRLDQLLKINSKREIIGSFSAASNVTGVISDDKQI